MEYRKLISFGKSSFVVSLPKPWVRQNNLKKGDMIHVDATGPSLLLSSNGSEKTKEEKQKVILIDGKTNFDINKEVCSAYIQNYSQIILKGTQIKNKVKEVQEAVQSLIALEVMEQTSNSIIAKDFLNMDTVSVKELVRKMDIVTRTMMLESCAIFNDDNYKSLNERDRDVNRLYHLHYRAILYNLENPLKALKNFNLTGLDLLRSKYIGFYIEAIADETRRIARYARLMKVSAQKQKEIQGLLQRIYDYYVETMKAAHNNDVELSLKLSGYKRKFDKELKKFEPETPHIPHLNGAINRMQRMISLIHNLGRVLYTIC